MRFFNLHLYCGFKVLDDNLLLTFLFISWWLRCIFIGLRTQVIYKKDFKYYESYPHIALICFVYLCPEKKDSRIKTYFLLNTQFPCHTWTLNCSSPWSIAITLMVCNDNSTLMASALESSCKSWRWCRKFEVEMMSCEVDVTGDKINHEFSLVTGQGTYMELERNSRTCFLHMEQGSFYMTLS